MRFITFSGVDGSGKSTQLEFLRERLEDGGKRVAYFHAVEFSLGNRIARYFRDDQAFEPGRERAITRASWCAVILRMKLLLIDTLRFRLFKRRLEREGCDALLSDRYFYDSLVNIEYLLSPFWRRLLALNLRVIAGSIPHPDHAFYFDISPETIMTRDRAPEQGVAYLRAKQELFQKRLVGWKMTVIDASRNKDETFQAIRKQI